MDSARFHNAIRIMWNLDRHHLVEAGVLEAGDEESWRSFRSKPCETAIRLPTERFEKLFKLIESRQPERLKS